MTTLMLDQQIMSSFEKNVKEIGIQTLLHHAFIVVICEHEVSFDLCIMWVEC